MTNAIRSRNQIIYLFDGRRWGEKIPKESFSNFVFFCSSICLTPQTCRRTSVSFISLFYPRLDGRETAGEQFVKSVGSPPDGETLSTGNIEQFLK